MGTMLLNSLLDDLQKLHPKYIDLSLKRITKLLEKLENPQLNLPPTIHIAGTNGKGSTLSFIEKILQKNDYKVHSYISPHLIHMRERFILANKMISKKKLYNTLLHVKKINNSEPITFFEITTAAALLLFSKVNADFLILETGLGGRLDATNVVSKKILNVITPISLDHREFLSNNIFKITNEKLGIINTKAMTIIGNQKKEVITHIKKKLINNKKIIYNKDFKIIKTSKKYFTLSYKKKLSKFNLPSLLGDYQIENAAVAIAAVYELKKLGFKIHKKKINKALTKTIWPARLEKFNYNNISCYLDGSHNIGGSEELRKFIKKNNKKTWIILGMLKNKDLNNFLKILKTNIYGIIAIEIPNEKNSYTKEDIKLICDKLKIKCFEKNNIKESIQFLSKIIKPQQIIITGSLYLAGQVRGLLI